MLEKADLKRDKSVVWNMIRKDTQAKSCWVSPKHSESVNAADNFANEQLINNRSQNIITRNDENTKISNRYFIWRNKNIAFDVSGNLKDTSYLASTIYKRNVSISYECYNWFRLMDLTSLVAILKNQSLNIFRHRK